MLLILLAGFWLRTTQFLDAPPGVIHDEVRNWLNTRLILGGDIRALYPYGGGREAFYLFIQAASFQLLGDNLLAARLPSIAFNMLGIVLSFGLARRLFGQVAGLVAAAGFATSFWSVMFARLAVRTGSMPVMALLTAYLVLRLVSARHPSIPAYALTGIALGMTFYTYPSALIFPAVLLGWLALLTVSRSGYLKGKWWPLIASLLLAGVIAIPLFRAWRDPATAARADEVNAPLEALFNGDINPVLANIGPVLGVFTTRGDNGLEFNIQGQPIFPTILLALLFYTGVFWSLWKLGAIRDTRFPGYALAILWLAGMLVPTLVTERPVNPSRTIGLLGIVYIFPAVAAETITRTVWHRHKIAGNLLAAALIGLAVTGQMAHTIQQYFTTWVDNPVVRFLYQDDYRVLARELDSWGAESGIAVGGLTPGEMDPATMRLLMADDKLAASIGFFDPQSALLIPDVLDQTPVIVIPAFVSLHPALASLLDEIETGRHVTHPSGSYEVYELYESALLPSTIEQGDFAAVNDGGEQRIARLAGLRLLSPAEPGASFTLLTRWTVHTAYNQPLRIFVHLVTEDGTLLTQSDVLGVPASQWRSNAYIIQTHDFSLPEDSPPGPYYVNIGVYNPESGQRLLTTDQPTPDYIHLLLPE